MHKELQDILVLIRDSNRPLALATLLRVEGSSYRRPGSRLLTDGDQVLRGSLSGGCLEGEVLARSNEILADGLPRLLRYDLRGEIDLVWGSGSGCEGVLDILVERIDPGAPPEWIGWLEAVIRHRHPLRLATSLESGFSRRRLEPGEKPRADETQETIQPPVSLWILGASDDSRPLLRLAKELGWEVGLLDHRPAFARAERFPEADQVLSGHPAQRVPELVLDSRSAVVLMTHNYLKDLEALRLLGRSDAGYLGLMGSRARSAKMMADLAAEGVDCGPRLHSPVGLDLGAEDPETIALAVLAEIQACFQGRIGGPLKAARTPVSAI
ncbi:XdhC/CoxI family protein [Geothrix limicola]|uniref:XdhC/CoxI family protein n=1 Tax=Geothrix limicola TaxID=2927978 RepID=A0ABQ5QCA6_9BACT|nr:XdhC/CoxI family protein [Geothrix limicola]GLH72457.1 XdhC/CoxI family protein [Geothrix limicola]